MKYIVSALLSIVFICSSAVAQSIPYSTITISGVAKEPYNKVSLFPDGHAVKPIKTSSIDTKTRQYSITIDVKKDLGTYESGDIGVDMRFWKDTNNNGQLNQGDERSQCHFIIWSPKTKQMLLQIYGGSTHKIESSAFKYDYGRILTEEVVAIQGMINYTNNSTAMEMVLDYPEQNAKVLSSIKPQYYMPMRGILQSGWVAIDPEGYVFNPKFVKFSQMNFEVEPASGNLEARQKDIPVYTHPSIEADVLTILKSGYTMSITGRVKGQPWYQLNAMQNGTKGYVMEE